MGGSLSENMRPDWREAIDDLLQLPYAYCEHTADKDSKSEHRKDHVHIIVAKSNTTSYNTSWRSSTSFPRQARRR